MFEAENEGYVSLEWSVERMWAAMGVSRNTLTKLNNKATREKDGDEPLKPQPNKSETGGNWWWDYIFMEGWKENFDNIYLVEIQVTTSLNINML